MRVRRTTWVSVAVNLVLALAQVVVGWVAHAQSLIADGLHTTSDLVADFLVLYANRKGSHPADPEHPYGHARIETAASLGLGLILIGTGAMFLFTAGARLQDGAQLPPVGSIALAVALATLAAKEALFRYVLRVAKQLRSSMLVANAWHARSDAASSLVVAIGLAGSLIGYRFLDQIAAAVVGFLIARTGWRFAQEALRELIDTGLTEGEVAGIRATLLKTQGVADVHELRTRRMAHQALVDAHVQVDPRLSVSEGHRIAEHARRRVLALHSKVVDVLVHVDVEDDLLEATDAVSVPDRTELVRHIDALLGDATPQVAPPTLHYLGGKAEAEVYLSREFCMDGERLSALERRIAACLERDPYLRAITINCRVAPS